MIPRRRCRFPLVRVLLAFVAVLPVAALVVGCQSGPRDCTTAADGDGSVRTVSCADPEAANRILQRFDAGGDCVAVGGVTEEYPYGSSDADATLCVGPKDVVPERGVNIAPVGACLTDTGRTPVQQVPCTDPAAAFRVLSRSDNVLLSGLSGCAEAPGSTDTYEWTLVDPRYPALKRGVFFCLNRADQDASTSVDRAQTGDCLAPTPDQSYAIVACTDPRATDRVVGRSDNPLLSGDLACRDAPGATSSVSRKQGLVKGYVLCLAPAR